MKEHPFSNISQQDILNMSKSELGELISKVHAPKQDTTLITATQRDSDGKLAISDEIEVKHQFTSAFWKKQSNSEYELFFNDGGIRNREVPSGDRHIFKSFISPYLKNKSDFIGIVRLYILNGAITQIRIEPKN